MNNIFRVPKFLYLHLQFAFKLLYLGPFCCSVAEYGQAQDAELPLIAPSEPLPESLSDEQIKILTLSVDKGLNALAGLQLEDGSFSTSDHAKTAVTSFAIMAYLSRGHKPGSGPYGQCLDKAINFVLSCQKKSGLFATKEINYPLINVEISSSYGFYSVGGAAKTYCHAISMLMLGEVYGLTESDRAFRISQGIKRGLKCTLQLWDIREGDEFDDGGFRYTRPWKSVEGDVSITGWHAASLRSIRNAGFEVPQKLMDRIAAYVIRNQHPNGGFRYMKSTPSSIVMTAAGTLCVALSGKHNHPALKKSCLFLNKFGASTRRSFLAHDGKYYPYYTCYYVTQAAIQMGGQLWARCMRECYTYLLPKQSSSGLWKTLGSASNYGSSYSTSLAIIALTPPLQILPIYQR